MDKIKIDNWDKESFNFINEECKITNDSIGNRVNKKLKIFFNNRTIMLNSILRNKKSIGLKTDTLVIKESYHDISKFESSFFIMNNYEEKGVVIYMKDDKIESIEKMEESFKVENHNNLLIKKSECFNEIKGFMNSASFITLFYLNKEGDLNIETKDVYLGTLID